MVLAAILEPKLKAKFRQAAGKVQQSYGEALSGIREAATSNPVTTLAVVAGVSFLLGIVLARRE